MIKELICKNNADYQVLFDRCQKNFDKLEKLGVKKTQLCIRKDNDDLKVKVIVDDRVYKSSRSRYDDKNVDLVKIVNSLLENAFVKTSELNKKKYDKKEPLFPKE